MDFTQQIIANRYALMTDLFRRLEEALEPFADDLDGFLARLFQARLPANWREQWHEFVDDQATRGFIVQPESIVSLENWIEAWARFCGLLPVAQSPIAELSAAPGNSAHAMQLSQTLASPPPFVQGPSANQETRLPAYEKGTGPTGQGGGEQFFDDKLTTAQEQLDQIKRVLESLGNVLDAAKLDEAIVVETEVDAVEDMIWRYNDALESARDAWLREDLSGDANARLLQMLTPRSFGLPMFVDDVQAERAHRQEMEISRRLGQRNVRMDRVIVGMQAAEWAGAGAGILLGGGVIISAAKKGGAWAVVKTIAVGAALAAGEQAIEAGLRAAGAGEQTIKGARLAAVVISFILLRRRMASETKPAVPRGPERSNRSEFGQLWDDTHPLIEGVIDRPRSPEHVFLQLTIAEEMQASGYYVRVGRRVPLSEFSGLRHSPDIQPDNIGLTADGKIDIIEILSPKQRREEVQSKLEKAWSQLPPEMRGQFLITDPKDAFQ
jgi:hypothetical protein